MGVWIGQAVYRLCVWLRVCPLVGPRRGLGVALCWSLACLDDVVEMLRSGAEWGEVWCSCFGGWLKVGVRLKGREKNRGKYFNAPRQATRRTGVA